MGRCRFLPDRYANCMAVKTVEVTASELHAADGGSANILEGILIHNAHALAVLYVAVYAGGVDSADPTVSEITTSNGIPIDPGTSLGFDLRSGDSIRAISDTGTTLVRVAVLRGG